MITNDKNGISSWELHRALGVTQKTAWFMLHRIRLAMQDKSASKLGNSGGPTEVDETFVGGSLTNMHKEKRKRFNAYGGGERKTIVMGLLDRDLRQVRTKIVPNVKRETLQAEVLNHVKYGSRVYTDQWAGYNGLHEDFLHDVVNHLETYVNGTVHTQGIENFWSLFKRTLREPTLPSSRFTYSGTLTSRLSDSITAPQKRIR